MSKGNHCNLLQAPSRAQLVLSLCAQWIIWSQAHCFLKHPAHLYSNILNVNWITIYSVRERALYDDDDEYLGVIQDNAVDYSLYGSQKHQILKRKNIYHSHNASYIRNVLQIFI